ncbi:MAG TPA: nucleotidyltransferase domain-containing protein [Thermococcus litoralis]|uniref:Nucleotidyltransferase domain-containing protein n=1 Tax=Thermococcus litoralis TaxID=2265 RepID=A0A7C5NY43_THELI|nr:nucleotidyltransferase domain-containing protein [Thermococcus litoralis]
MMLSDLKKKLSELAKDFKEKTPDIWDILLYGSIVKGKEAPNDIDITVILTNGDPFKAAFQFKQMLENNGFSPEGLDVKGFLINELFNENNLISFALLTEGYSLTRDKFLHEELNAKGYTLFKFSYSNLTSSEKVRFIYSLRGRNKREGILQKLNALELATGIVLVPVHATFEFKEFLSRWKIEYEYAPILLGEFKREVGGL